MFTLEVACYEYSFVNTEEQKKLHKRWEAKNKVEENRRNLAEKCGEATKLHYSEQLKAALILPEVCCSVAKQLYYSGSYFAPGSYHPDYS